MIIYKDGEKQDFEALMKLLEVVGGDREPGMDPQTFIVAKDEEKLVGCVRVKKFSDGSLELASLAVLPDYRRQGIGKTLVAKILEKEKSRPIYLMCSVEKENFYNLNNFIKISPDDLPLALKEEYNKVLTRVNLPANQILVMNLNH